MNRILVAGTFDGIHPGHESFLHQARALGDELVVIVARDANAKARRGYLPKHPEAERLAAIRALPMVDQAELGDSKDFLRPVVEFAPNVLALGYDQWPDEASLITQLRARDLSDVKVVRLAAFKPEQYHSSRLNR